MRSPGTIPEQPATPAPSFQADGDASLASWLSPVVAAAYRAAIYLCRDRESAALLVERVVLRAFQRYTGGGSNAEFKLWLLREVVDDANTGRSAEPQAAVADGAAVRQPLLRLLGRSGREDGITGAATTPQWSAEQIAAAIRELPPEYGVVVALHFADDLSYADLASVLRAPVDAARARLHLGRRLLWRALACAEVRS